jgi:hypothetical protein
MPQVSGRLLVRGPAEHGFTGDCKVSTARNSSRKAVSMAASFYARQPSGFLVTWPIDRRYRKLASSKMNLILAISEGIESAGVTTSSTLMR